MTTPQKQPGLSIKVTAAALIGIVLIAANLRAATAGVGTLLPQVMMDMQWSAALASGLVALPLLCFAILSPFVPRLSHTLGPGWTVVLSLAVLTAGILTRSIAGPILIWVGTALIGAGIAVLNVITPALVKHDFAHRAGSVTSTYSAVQGGAGALATVAIAMVIAVHEDAWQLALATPVVLSLFACGFWLWRAASTKGSSTRRVAAEVRGARVNPWSRKLAWQLALFMGMQSTVFYVLITWMPAIEQSSGGTASSSALNQTYLQLAALVATVLSAGILQRSADQRGVIALSGALMAAALVGTLCAPQLAVVWAILAGAAGGLTLVTALLLFGLRTQTSRETEAVSGMAQSMGYLLAAGGPFLFGLLHDTAGSWTPVIASLLVLVVIQCLAGMRAAVPGQVFEKKIDQPRGRRPLTLRKPVRAPERATRSVNRSPGPRSENNRRPESDRKLRRSGAGSPRAKAEVTSQTTRGKRA